MGMNHKIDPNDSIIAVDDIESFIKHMNPKTVDIFPLIGFSCII